MKKSDLAECRTENQCSFRAVSSNAFLAGMNNESIRNLIDYETSGAKFFAGFLTAFIACLIPSRMALKVQPAEALRAEN